jgi:hypothetical protein
MKSKPPITDKSGKKPAQKFSNLASAISLFKTLILCATVLAIVWLLLNFFGFKSDPRLGDSNKTFTVGALVIGGQEVQKGYDELVKYLNDSSQAKFKLDPVVISTENALKQAKEKIEKAEWDIAFTSEPFTSIAAINQGYFFVARMTQDAPIIQSAVIVKNENLAIKKVDDINKNTKLAISDPNNVAFYYMPIYDLYGRAFQGVRQPAPFLKSSIEALDTGRVDAAVVLYGNGFKTDPLSKIEAGINRGDYRVISLSRPILPGSVYISPKLDKERNFVEKLLIEAPDNIKKGSKYAIGQREEDYGFFKGLQRRVDAVLDCSGSNPRTTNIYDLSVKKCKENVDGIVSSVRQVDSNKVELIVRSISTEYGVLLKQSDLLEKISKAFALGSVQSLTDLYMNLDKISIKIVNAMPKEDTKSGTIYFDFIDSPDNDIKSFEVIKKNTV